MTPPRWADRLLHRRLAADERDELIGDLHEQFHARAAAHGRRAAVRWYWRQAWALLWGFSVHRRDVVSTNHERTRGRWLAGNWASDIKYGWRSLVHSRSFSVVALLTLTSGIGLSTALFSLVSGILFHPLPYSAPERLVRLTEVRSGPRSLNSSGALMDTTIGEWLRQATTVDALSPYTDSDLVAALPGGPASVHTANVGPQFFRVLSVTPVRGRLLGEGDGAGDSSPAVVISQRLWQRDFAAAADIAAKTLILDDKATTIVGVLPAAFAWPSTDTDIWRIGEEFHLGRRWPAPGQPRSFAMSADVIARLKPGVSLDDVRREGNRISLSIAMADPNFAEGTVTPAVLGVTRLLDDLTAPVRPLLLIFSAGMALVLLAGCINLANLLLARHTTRQRELSVRLALGASRWRVLRPVLVELLMLGAAGGAAGALLAALLVDLLPRIAPHQLPRLDAVHFDVHTLLFAAGASIATALLVGALPIVQMPAVSIREATSPHGRVQLSAGTGSGDRFRSTLAATQIGLAALLLVGALLVVRSLWALTHVHPGYRSEGVLTFQFGLPENVYSQHGRQPALYRDTLDALRHLPGVSEVGSALTLPMRQLSHRSSVNVVGRPIVPVHDVNEMAVTNTVSPTYLPALGTRVLEGRGFTAADDANGELVALIDETVRDRYFPGEDPVGHSLMGYARHEFKIVGVVEAVHLGPRQDAPPPTIYYSVSQIPEALAYSPYGGFVVRTTGDPNALIPAIREQLRRIDPTVPLTNVRALTDELSESAAQPRFFAIVAALFSVMALSTAVLGIYGVLAYGVERRRVEFGVRRALGATERDVLWLVGRHAVRLTLVGLAVGLAGAALTTRWMHAILFRVTPLDAGAFAGAAVFICLVVTAASWPPVRRALRMDPARALRMD